MQSFQFLRESFSDMSCHKQLPYISAQMGMTGVQLCNGQPMSLRQQTSQNQVSNDLLKSSQEMFD